MIGEKNSVFSTRKPVNAISGLSSGLKSVVKGVVSGVTLTVAAPIVGAKEKGVGGFF